MAFQKGHTVSGLPRNRKVRITAADFKNIWDTADKAKLLMNQVGHQMQMAYGKRWVERSLKVNKVITQFQQLMANQWFDSEGQHISFDDSVARQPTGKNANGQRTIF